MSSLKSKRVITAVIFCAMVFLSSIFELKGSLLEYVIGYYELGSSDQGLAALLSSFGGMAAFVLALFMIGRVRKLRLLTAGFSPEEVLLRLILYYSNLLIGFIASFRIVKREAANQRVELEEEAV